MKMTLLDIVQDVLSSMDSDEVNSINDTQEALDVARIVRNSYYHIVGLVDLPVHFELFELVATTGATPVLMSLPENVINISWIKYNQKLTSETSNNYQEVYWQDFDVQMRNQEMLNTDDTGIDTMQIVRGTATIDYKFNSDRFPLYYTTWDNRSVLFDSYDASEDDHLQSNKTECYGLLDTVFTLTDEFVPDLDHRQFPLLLNESMAEASLTKRQQVNPKAEQRSKAHLINTQRTKRDIPSPWTEYNAIPNYGRRGPVSSITTRAMRSGK